MWAFAAAAWACDGADYDETVVGWSADGTQVLLRRALTRPGAEDPPDPATPFLELVLVDLGTLAPVKAWQVLSLGEKNDVARRGARWKAAEAELVAAKVAIDGAQRPLAAPFAIGGHAGLEVETGGCDDWARTYTLKSPTGSRALATGGCGAEEGLYTFAAWSAPAGRGVLLVADTGCVGHKRRFWVPTASLP